MGNDDASPLSCFIISLWLFSPVQSFFFFSFVLKKNKSMSILNRFHCSLSFSSYSAFLSCSDATAVQTPFPPADSVASLRRCGLGVLVAERGMGWGWFVRLPHQAHQPITCEGKELANRFYNGTLRTVTQYHKPLSSPHTSYCIIPPMLRN